MNKRFKHNPFRLGPVSMDGPGTGGFFGYGHYSQSNDQNNYSNALIGMQEAFQHLQQTPSNKHIYNTLVNADDDIPSFALGGHHVIVTNEELSLVITSSTSFLLHEFLVNPGNYKLFPRLSNLTRS